jgi:hypothetical protein
MNKILRTFLATLLLLTTSALVFAQDATSTPDPEMDMTPTDEQTTFNDVAWVYYVDPDVTTMSQVTNTETLANITDNSQDYYGAVVTIEGSLINFVGSRMFEVGEEALVTNSNVLVVNNSSQPLPASLIEGVDVRITGRVLPSYDVVQDDANWVYTPFDAAMTEDAQSQEGNQNNGRLNMVDFVHSGYIPGVFGGHTVFEVLNVENIEVLNYEGLIVND